MLRSHPRTILARKSRPGRSRRRFSPENRETVTTKDELVECFDELVESNDPNALNQAFVERLAKARDHIVPILEQPELPATNNLGERQIRPIVVHRKLGAGNKTEKGAKTTAALASLTATCHQQAILFAKVAYCLLTGPVGQPVRFWIPEPDPDPVPS